jgi:hypothetical protein
MWQERIALLRQAGLLRTNQSPGFSMDQRQVMVWLNADDRLLLIAENGSGRCGFAAGGFHDIDGTGTQGTILALAVDLHQRDSAQCARPLLLALMGWWHDNGVRRISRPELPLLASEKALLATLDHSEQPGPAIHPVARVEWVQFGKGTS